MYLEGGDNVGLDAIAGMLVDLVEFEVSNERVEGHRAADDCGIIAH